MALGTFAPGHYTMTYNGSATGLIEGERRFQRAYRSEDVRSDLYGDTVIDGVYRGADVFLQCVFKEWTAIIEDIIWPFNTSDLGATGVHGRLLSDLAKVLILTVVAGTPAATNGPTTITANKAILLRDHTIDIPLGNVQRHVPVTFQLLPYSDSGTIRHFSTT